MLTLDEAKAHLRVDGTDDDTLIQGFVDAAQEYIEAIITPTADDGEEPVVPAVTETQRQACRLLVGHWYEHREAIAEGSISKVPSAFDMLLFVNRPAAGLF